MPITVWISRLGNISSGTLTFGFNNAVLINEFLLWNETISSAIRGFELYADTDNNFGNGGTTSLLSSEAIQQGGRTVPAQRFSLMTPTRTQYVHLNILSNYDGPSLSAGEVAFQVEVLFEFGPIPGIILIVAAGGINYFQRKGKKGQK